MAGTVAVTWSNGPMGELIDLSHTIGDGTITYPGLPGPVITDHMSRAESRERYAPGYEFQIGHIEMVSNTGTYLDTPFHRFADGHDLAGLDLQRVAAVPGLVVDASGAQAIGADLLAGLDVAAAPCCCAPGGTATGEPMPTATRVTRSSVSTSPSCSSRRARRSWGSTR